MGEHGAAGWGRSTARAFVSAVCEMLSVLIGCALDSGPSPYTVSGAAVPIASAVQQGTAPIMSAERLCHHPARIKAADMFPLKLRAVQLHQSYTGASRC